MNDKKLFDYIFSGQILEFETHAFMNNEDFWGSICASIVGSTCSYVLCIGDGAHSDSTQLLMPELGFQTGMITEKHGDFSI